MADLKQHVDTSREKNLQVKELLTLQEKEGIVH